MNFAPGGEDCNDAEGVGIADVNSAGEDVSVGRGER